jgi:ribosomal protein S6|tara:strand:- start:1831 stop:2139 length:309 start_codon:yes stop_codon:yes gene_type:complete
MKQISEINNYESMVVVSSNCTEVELKTIAFSYAQQLKKLGASDISVVSRGRRDFAYPTKRIKTGYFVEMFFNSSPQILPIFENKLRLDKNIIRSLITNLSKS